jgi:hypothetical protein
MLYRVGWIDGLEAVRPVSIASKGGCRATLVAGTALA